MKTLDHKPPRVPQRFLRWYCKPELLEDLEGDIHEDFNKRYARSGRRTARAFYWLDVIRFFRPFAIKNVFKTQINSSMFKLNSLIAFRNLAKNKLYSFINVTGLAIGIAACLIIAHYVTFQLSFDRFNENADRIYRVHTGTTQQGTDLGVSPHSGFALIPALSQDIPEIDMASRIHPYYGGGVVSRVVDSVNTGSFREESLIFVEPDFLKMFSYEFTQGDPERALDDPNSVIITEETKVKYFGNDGKSVIGEILNVNGGWSNGNLKVTGVIKEVPASSNLQFDFLLPISLVLQQRQYQNEGADWGWTNFYSYVMLNPQTTEAATETKMARLMHKYLGEALEDQGYEQILSLQNITDLHLRSETGADDLVQAGDIKSVYFMIVIALFIIVIAWINFINLSTAKASERGLEVGIKKAMGAHKRQLVWQFLTESFWVNLIAVVLAVIVTYAAMPALSETIGETLEVNLLHPTMLTALIALILAGPFLAGIYPAFVLSSFKTVIALKGKFVSKGSHAFTLRRGLVVFQFVISALLIAGTFAVSKQLTFMQNQDTGMNLSQIVAVRGPEVNVSRAGFETFKNSISQIAAVESFTASRSVPGAGYNWYTEARKTGTPTSSSTGLSVTWVDESFTETFGLDMVSGRDFTEAVRQTANGIIVNEATLADFDLGSAEEALTQSIVIGSDTMAIRGVVKDHHWNSLHSEYEPAAFIFRWISIDYFSLKVNPTNVKATMDEIEEQYNAAFPGNPIEYYFLDEFFNRQYQADLAFANIFKAFSVFAILAACMGLFGLASYSVVQKAKEIGIRRVLGASGTEITLLFSKRYLLLMLLANIIAVPIAFYGIDQWLDNFAFSINISADLFIIPAILLVLIAALTVSFQTLRAALSNPVKNLRRE